MTVTTRKKQSKLSNPKASQSFISPLVMIGGGILLVGLLAFGMAQVLGTNLNQGPVSSAIQNNVPASSAISASSHTSQGGKDAPVDTADPETKYLGPATDVAGLALAEEGQAGQPTLVWFHADWCHVCQQVKPEVVNLGQELDY